MVKKKVAHVAEIEARLVREIRRGRAISRYELAGLLKLAPSTVGIYVDRLLENGFLKEDVVSKPQRRGRPIQKLDLSTRAGCFIGAEFEAENVHAVCVDFSGIIIARHSVSLPSRSGAKEVMNGLKEAIHKVRAKNDLPLFGIGIGVPGTVDPVRGVALDYRFIEGWQDIPISQTLTECFKVPILLENNARATALGSLMFDEGKKTGDFVSLLVRSGVGAGIVTNGVLQRGHSFLAGEVGRIQSAWTDPAQGGFDTVEAVASVKGIADFVRAKLEEGIPSQLAESTSGVTIQMIIAAANDGDDLARRAILRATGSLGWLAHVIGLVVNPQSIILAGPLNALGDWYRMEVQAALNTYAALARTERPIIVLSGLDDEAGALGAASLAMDAWRPDYGKKSGR